MVKDRKICSKCGTDKPLTSFRRKSASPDGRAGNCRDCADLYMRRYRARTRTKRLAYNKQYYSSPRGREVLANYRRRHENKLEAQKVMWNAIKAGQLVKARACEQCGRETRLDGHHDDYAKPLDVRWLCRKCHKFWHKVHGEALNA